MGQTRNTVMFGFEHDGVSGSGGGGIRTRDLWVMSPTSCRCSTPRHTRGDCCLTGLCAGQWVGSGGRGAPAAASPPTGSPPQYSPALHWVTTGFGMGPGGASTLSATDTPPPPDRTHLPASQSGITDGVDAQSMGGGAGPGQDARPVLPVGNGAFRPAWCLLTQAGGDPPSAMSTGRLRSVTGRPPPASQPGRLPGAFLFSDGETRLGAGFPLRCFQRFAHPNVATQRCRLPDNWLTSGSSTPVLSY